MTNFYTYLHCKPDLTPFYVGKGSLIRCYNFSRRNQHHKNIVAKYGRENIQIIIFKKDSEKSAFASEKRLIKMLRNAGFNLANKTDGGEGSSGYISTDQTRLKLSMAGKGRVGIKHTPETKAKLSRLATGRKSGFCGKCHSEKTRLKLSESSRGNKNCVGHKHSNERRVKNSQSHIGKKASVETRAKMSASRSGKRQLFCKKCQGTEFKHCGRCVSCYRVYQEEYREKHREKAKLTSAKWRLENIP